MQKAHEIIIAGFGGQGVLSMGQIIAYAAIKEGKEVSWMPSYGPEMRGGTANCIVIVAESRISSPIVSTFDSAILLNQPSVDKFAALVKPAGVILFESSTVITAPSRHDVEIAGIGANEEALRLASRQVSNMVMLGAFLSFRPIVAPENVLKALKEVLPERHHHLLPLNEKALEKGKALAMEMSAKKVS